ncbi:hypothetical protein FOZ62_013001, partial [Perkinsus olseni]
DRLLHDGNLTFRDCGSWLGQLLGHLPVADRLRPVVGLGRRSLGKKAGNTKASWRRLVDDESKQICLYICQLLRRLGDPAHGTWRTPDPSEELHCFIDSSELAMGVSILDSKNNVIEDDCHLRPADAHNIDNSSRPSLHINISELDS